jgi:glutamate carboxypeptidase
LITNDDPEHWHPTYNIGLLAGGEARNQVAHHAEATIDIRFPDHASKQQIITALATLTPQYPHVTLEVLFDEADHGTDPDEPHLAPYLEALRLELGAAPHAAAFERAHGTSDARFFYAGGCRIIDRPDGGDIHADTEWLDLESFYTHYRVLRRYVHAVVGPDAR